MNKKIVLSLGLLVSIPALRAETAPTLSPAPAADPVAEKATKEAATVAVQAQEQKKEKLMSFQCADRLLQEAIAKKILGGLTGDEFGLRAEYYVRTVVMKAQTKEEQQALIEKVTVEDIVAIELPAEPEKELETAATTQADDKGTTAEEAKEELKAASQTDKTETDAA